MEGKDPKTGHYLPGNRFWEARSSHGKAPIYAGPEELLPACVEYFEWVHENPLFEAKPFAYEGNVTFANIPKVRAMTVAALCNFLGIARSTWDNWKNKRDDLKDAIDWVESIIYQQKFEGASAGMLVPQIIARDLGLADNQNLNASMSVSFFGADADL